MKNGYWALAVLLFFGMMSTYYFGCKKTDSPFGIYAPNGLDVPSPTPLPFSGQISVWVIDDAVTINGPALTGISVIVTDPMGNAVTQNTSLGVATFAYSNVNPGVWRVEVPTQNVYSFSQNSVTLNAANPSQPVTFEAKKVNSLVIAPSPASYTNGQIQGNLILNVNYPQQGGLNVPISLSVSGVPFAWVASLFPATIGDVTNNSALTLVIPPCSLQSAALTVMGTRQDSITVFSSPVSVTKNYPVTLQVNWKFRAPKNNSNSCSGTSPDFSWYMDISSTTNINCFPQTVSLSFSNNGSGVAPTPSSDSFVLSPSTTHTTSFSTMSTSSSLTCNYTFSSSLGTISGSFGFDPHWNNCYFQGDGSNGQVFFKTY